MALNVFNEVTSKRVTAYYEKDENRMGLQLEAWFPRVKQKGIRFSLIKGKQGLPVALSASSLDANVLFRDFEGFEVLEGKLPFFKEAIKFNEELLFKIQELSEDYGKEIVAQFFETGTNDLLDGAEVTAERQRGQLLSTGTIAITENGVSKNIDYGFSTSTQFKTETTLWSATGATPFKSLSARVEEYEDLMGEKPAVALMTSEVFSKLRNDEEILTVFENLATPNPSPTKDEVRAYIENRLGISIVIYDKKYIKARDNKKTAVKYLATDRYTLLPNTYLGTTIYGDTPESLASETKRPNSNFLDAVTTKNFVTVSTWEVYDPVTVEVKVSEHCAPSCPLIDKLYIVKVL